METVEEAQLKLIKLEMDKGNFGKAKELGSLPKFRSSVQIQKKMIEIALIQKDYQTAKEIAEREEFIDNEIIQSQRIKIAIEQDETEVAKEIGKRFKNDPVIQSQMLKIAFEENDNDTIDKLKNNERFKDDSSIQAQLINIEIKKGNFDNAMKIGRRDIFKNDSYIQTQMLEIARTLGDIDWANSIADNPPFRSRSGIQYRRILIQIDNAIEQYKEGEFQKNKEMLERARVNCENEEIQSDDRIQLLKKKIDFLLSNMDTEKVKKQFLNKIYTKLYYGVIGKKEIDEIEEREELSEYERMLVLLAIYEKQGNRNTCDSMIKKLEHRNKDNFDDVQNKTFNVIIERIKNKKPKPFNWGGYDDLLKWTIDKNVVKEIKTDANGGELQINERGGK